MRGFFGGFSIRCPEGATLLLHPCLVALPFWRICYVPKPSLILGLLDVCSIFRRCDQSQVFARAVEPVPVLVIDNIAKACAQY